MIRKIIKIDEDKCNGCGICVTACAEGAIGLVNGKAVLLRDDYCDGLGNCLPACPTDAICLIEREALEYNEELVQENISRMTNEMSCGCPGTNVKSFNRAQQPILENNKMPSQLSQWPVQLRLVSVNASFFNHAHLLIAADCAAYAHASFHNTFMKNKITLIGCPKLDDVDYSNKLTAILKENNIKSVTVIRMEVPCCGGIENAVKTALKNSGKLIQWQVITLSTQGDIIE